jgi:hypothetical protein
MANGEVFSIAVVCEGDADRKTVCTLIDRVLCEHVDWITPEVLDDYRQWRGLTDAEQFLKASNVRSEAKRRNIATLGRFNNEPGEFYFRAARLAFLLLSGTDPKPHAVVFVVDTDDILQKRTGCEQARESGSWEFKIALGLPHTKRECWVLAAYDPTNEADIDRLKTLRQQLGFDPRLNSHELTATGDDDKKSAKRVHRDLLQDGESCWDRADLRTLRDRGSQNGLADFITEIESRLIPHFTGRKP